MLLPVSPYAVAVFLWESHRFKKIHGSVYGCWENLNELCEFDGKFAFVGVPCQIQALEKLKSLNPHVKATTFLTIGLFVGD